MYNIHFLILIVFVQASENETDRESLQSQSRENPNVASKNTSYPPAAAQIPYYNVTSTPSLMLKTSILSLEENQK